MSGGNMATITSKNIIPKFGENYDVGYIGFTFHGDFISRGIAYFTRWSRLSDIPVAHALVVTGENECVEALINTGVTKTNLDKYFNNPKCKIFFRKPKRWNKKIGHEIADAALSKIGEAYDSFIIGLQALFGTILGKFLNFITFNNVEKFSSSSFENSSKWICSELVAYALDSCSRYQGKGVLTHPFSSITPQELFEDKVIFTAWKKGAIR